MNTQRTITDAQGAPGSVSYGPPEPCLICGNPCGVRVDGFALHIPCWQLTTAPDRQLWGAPAAAPAAESAAPRQEAVAAAPPSPPTRGGTPIGQRRTTTGSRPGPTGPLAAVVGADTTWLSNGREVPTPEAILHVGDLVTFAQELGLGMALAAHGRRAAGQVWITQEAAEVWEMDLQELTKETNPEKLNVLAQDLTAEADFVTHAQAEGWTVASPDRRGLGQWTRVFADKRNPVWVVLLPAQVGTDSPLLAGDPSPAELAARLGRFAATLGFPWVISPAVTGRDHMKALRQNSREEFAAHKPTPPAEMGNLEVPFSWTRVPTEEEQQHEFVHAYDRGGSYLAAIAGVDFGVGEATHHPEGREFDPKVPGYWLVDVPESGDWRVPHPLDPTGKASGTGHQRWVTTPTLQIAQEMGFEPEVTEAFTWSSKGRVMEPWYNAVRDARTAFLQAPQDDEEARAELNMLKAVYTRTIGMMGSHNHLAGQEGYAPERRHFIVAKSNANMLRRIRQIGQDTGRWPVAVDTDTILYTSDEPDPVKAWPLADAPEGKRHFGRGLGQYKPEGTSELAYQLPFLTGDRYKGKDALMGSDD